MEFSHQSQRPRHSFQSRGRRTRTSRSPLVYWWLWQDPGDKDRRSSGRTSQTKKWDIIAVFNGGLYQDEDVFLALLVKVVGKGWQISELDFVVSEIFLVLHVVNVSVLDVLHRKDKDVDFWAPRFFPGLLYQ